MAATPQRALIVIDLQNDYFPDGKFPLWNTEAVLAQVESAIARARGQGVPVILVQHIADAPNGAAPFFNASTARLSSPWSATIIRGMTSSFSLRIRRISRQLPPGIVQAERMRSGFSPKAAARSLAAVTVRMSGCGFCFIKVRMI